MSKQKKSKITIVPDDHGDKGLASRDYVQKEIAEGNCKHFGIEFAPEYERDGLIPSGLIQRINQGTAKDIEIDKTGIFAPILKEIAEKNKKTPRSCKVTAWKAKRNTKIIDPDTGEDMATKEDLLKDDKKNVENIEKHLSSDTPMLLLSGVEHVSNLAGLLKQNGHDVEFVTANYKDENTFLIQRKK